LLLITKQILSSREGKVGKTSILLRFVHDQFNKQHLSTIQASFLNKKINFENDDNRNCRVNLNIWDTAGQGKMQLFSLSYLMLSVNDNIHYLFVI